jgi:hypothetical protein
MVRGEESEVDERRESNLEKKNEVSSVQPSSSGIDKDQGGSWWDSARPHLKRYGKSFAVAGPFGLAVTGVGDTAPYVAKEVRRAIDGLRGFEG